MKTKYLTLVLIILVAAVGFSGCSFITLETPFADVNKLGTAISPGKNITIESTNGPVTIEYCAPTKRRIIWNGESREISLLKSSLINGIYNDFAKFDQPIGNIYGVEYEESTIALKTDSDVKNFITFHKQSGFEHRVNAQLLISFEIKKKLRFGIRTWNKEYLSIVIRKYERAVGGIR